MQIEELVLYSHSGQTRRLKFRLGELNVITGESLTGKSSLVNIIRYCLGSKNANVPVGPISNTVAWFGALLDIEGSKIFVGRPSDVGHAGEMSAAMLQIAPEALPEFRDLNVNTNTDELRAYFAAAIGIEPDVTIATIGLASRGEAATFGNSLFYCFQGQGEIANPEQLFHRQNRPYHPEIIRDTLPYFLGAMVLADLRSREQMTKTRRALRAAERKLADAELSKDSEVVRARTLLGEARDASLVSVDDFYAGNSSESDARSRLRAVIQRPLEQSRTDEIGHTFDDLRSEQIRVRDRARQIAEQVRGLDDFGLGIERYSYELSEQSARLSSIGLIDDLRDDALCPLCEQALARDAAFNDLTYFATEADRISQRLAVAARDTPRIENARHQLVEERARLDLELQAIDIAMESLASTNDAIARKRDEVNVQSYIRGKIAEYLDSSPDVDNLDLESLRVDVSGLEAEIERLSKLFNKDVVMSRVSSALARVSRDLTDIAVALKLEHAEHGVRLDLARLTVVADMPEGPAYLDANQIGSGQNWVGYHLSAYLALQQFFISNSRPVPRFIVFDQPSQVFFPKDKSGDKQFDELPDDDRRKTKELYRAMYDAIQRSNGKLQIIALDHASFDDEWFAESVVESWRGGNALIPADWISS